MKKVICGKLYDTDKARWLGSAEGGEGIDGWQETLYRKRTGEYFLHGTGGARTRYAVIIDDNNWSGGEQIMPLTYEAARSWAEKHLDADKYTDIFGIPGEDAGDVALYVRIPADLDMLVRARAAEQGVSVAALVVDALRTAVK